MTPGPRVTRGALMRPLRDMGAKFAVGAPLMAPWFQAGTDPAGRVKCKICRRGAIDGALVSGGYGSCRGAINGALVSGG